MKNINSKLLIMLILFFVSCGKSEIPTIDLEKVIINAEVLTFNDLTNSQKEKLQYCCNYYPNNWRDGIEYKKEDAFFVKIKIDNSLLAKLSESNAFSEKDLLSNNEFYLYGKYYNRWSFISVDGDKIIETEKFEGHRTLEVIRNKNIDEVIIGPLPKKPQKMFIEISDSKNYPNMTPEFNIK
jgi:hypothetical protein